MKNFVPSLIQPTAGVGNDIDCTSPTGAPSRRHELPASSVTYSASPLPSRQCCASTTTKIFVSVPPSSLVKFERRVHVAPSSVLTSKNGTKKFPDGPAPNTTI